MVISQVSTRRKERNSISINYMVCLHMTRLRNFCSLHSSHDMKRITLVHQQGTNNSIVQHKGCIAGDIHILLPSRAFCFSKQGLIPFKIQLWLKNTEVKAEVTDRDEGAPQKVLGSPVGPFLQEQVCSGGSGAQLSLSQHVVMPCCIFFTRPAETRETDHISRACFVSRLSASSRQFSGYRRFW